MKNHLPLLSLCLLLAGCVGVDYRLGTPPASDPSAYQPVDFTKLASGAFTAELDGKLVALRCRFTHAYSLDGRSLQGQVSSPDGGTPGMVGVSFYDVLRDRVVGLKMGDIVTLRGKVRTASSAYGTGNYLEVYFVDRP